jgi:pullulanase
MKKLKLITGMLISTLMLSLTACNPSSSTTTTNELTLEQVGEIPEGYLRLNYIGSGAAVQAWIWGDFAESAIAECTSWGDKGFPVTGLNGNYRCFDIPLAQNPSLVNFIVLSDTFGKLSGDADCTFLFPQKYNEIFVDGSGNITIDTNGNLPRGLTGATIVSETEIELEGAGISLTTSNLSVKNGDTPVSFTVSDFTVTVDGISLKDVSSITISYTDELGTDTVTALISDDLMDDWYSIDDVSELGYNSTTGIFKTWAPLATSVKVILFADATAVANNTPVTDGDTVVEIALTRTEKGIWQNTSDASDIVSTNKYYKYRLVNNLVTYDVPDIWAKVASKDSKATQIIDIDDSDAKPASWEASYTNPFGSSGAEDKAYTEAVIYEMHIRDWSRAFVPTSTGTFEDITDALGNDGAGEFAQHLVDLGITHVQIVPMFEYATAGSNDSDYNWGYNPYNYNTPESRYVKNMTDGTDAVKSMRAMIKAFHDAGIAVNMDVVFNHTSGTKTGSIYDMTIPEYFYRMTNGTYSNGSGCGNEVATNHEMVKNFVIDSLKHWMLDYHINGFRFDLMGLHETSTMKAIYEALSEIDPNVMVYGEPWTGGTSTVVSGVSKTTIDSCTSGYAVNGVACFNDDFRNAIKGAEFGGFKKGQVQGTFDDKSIIKGLLGSWKMATPSTYKGFTFKLGRSINYAECHDNYTLFDKLAMSYLELKPESITVPVNLIGKLSSEGLEEVKKQDKLAAAYLFLAQGTPFINGGQEFLRTKMGDENSYASSDTINQIDLSFKETYIDVYNTYKGLIALRKANIDAFGITNTTATANSTTASVVSTGVIKYETGDFCVYFNATSDSVTISTTGYTKVVDVTTGTPTESTTLPSSVAAKSFVILKK